MRNDQNDDSNKDSETQIVDFEAVRNKKLTEKRRKNERIFFHRMMTVYAQENNGSLREIQIVDVSEDGMSFQIPYDANDIWPQNLDEIAVRLYYSNDTYLPLVIRVQNSRPMIDEGMRYVRFGCSVDQTTTSFQVFLQFVRFLKLYSEAAHKDTGRSTFFYG